MIIGPRGNGQTKEEGEDGTKGTPRERRAIHSQRNPKEAQGELRHHCVQPKYGERDYNYNTFTIGEGMGGAVGGYGSAFNLPT